MYIIGGEGGEDGFKGERDGKEKGGSLFLI